MDVRTAVALQIYKALILEPESPEYTAIATQVQEDLEIGAPQPIGERLAIAAVRMADDLLAALNAPARGYAVEPDPPQTESQPFREGDGAGVVAILDDLPQIQHPN